MRTETELTIKYCNKINVDCFGCDHQQDQYITKKKGPFGIIKQQYIKYICGALNIQLSSDLLNLWDMTKEQCPCHFEKWVQTNPDITEFVIVPTYRFTLEAGKIISQEIEEELIDNEAKI